MSEAFLLSAQDVTEIREWISEQKRTREAQKPATGNPPAGTATDAYLAYPPVDERLPARVGNQPGALKCCLYVIREGDGTPENRTLEPVIDGRDNLGNVIHKRVWVYNIYEAEGDANQYFEIFRSKTGYFFAERPSSANTTTTTTTVNPNLPTTTTTPSPNTPSCSGKCKWTWVSASNKWTLTQDNCALAPSTTTTTTTLTPTTTTPCPCPTTTTTAGPTSTAAPTTTLGPCSGACIYRCEFVGDPGVLTWVPFSDTCGAPCTCGTALSGACTPNLSTQDVGCTSTTAAPTTTTTTGDPNDACRCAYPDVCGETNGDCVTTFCITGEVEGDPDCTTTGEPTTTCDCNTTTTPSPEAACTDGCLWTSVPRNGTIIWVLVQDNCASYCPCPYPGAAPIICSDVITGCIQTTQPPQTTPAPCTGSCEYIWSAEAGVWYYQNDTCNRRAYSCYCEAPSTPGNVDCAPQSVPCASHTTTEDPNTPTTVPPCDVCYTTTTTTSAPTTTTTPNPCSLKCTWSWNGTTWDNDADPCAGSCPCAEPGYDGQDAGCELAYTDCGTGTTTTANPFGACCYNPTNLACVYVTEDNCNDLGGHWTQGLSCLQINCATTPAPTTTTDPGGYGACCLPNGLCHITSASGCAASGGQFFLDTDCTVGLCATTTTAAPTTTTTTTTAGPGACCYGLLANNLCIEVYDEVECRDVYRGQYQGPGTDCDPNPCPGVTTTTGSPTTTTTSVPGCTGNACTLVCIGGILVEWPSDQCGTGCACGSGSMGPGVACEDEGSVHPTNCRTL